MLPIKVMKSMRGVSLLEVLITTVILSIGLLGIAGLQLSSMRNNHSAEMRSIATIQAYDMIERMRSNTAGVEAGVYNAVNGIPQSVASCGAGESCTAQELASMDIAEWNTDNQNLLPSGQGTVTGSGAGSVFTVRIMWDDTRSGVSGTGCDPSDSDDLKCFETSVEL